MLDQSLSYSCLRLSVCQVAERENPPVVITLGVLSLREDGGVEREEREEREGVASA